MSALTADVVIIGAGILGAATAFELAARGRRVVVLERGSPNREGSGTTAGNLHVQAVHTRRPGQAVPLDARRFLPLQKASSDLWQDIPDRLGADIELNRAGGVTVAETEAQRAELITKAGWEASEGLVTEVLDGDAAREAVPQLGRTVLAATWCPSDGYANPLLVTPAYLAGAVDLGAEVRHGTPVTALARRGAGWSVRAGELEVHAPAVIDVAGPWLASVAALAGVQLAMAPVSIQMHATVRVPPMLSRLVQHIGEGLSVKQVAAGSLLIGGGWPSASRSGQDWDSPERTPASVSSIVGNLAAATRILPLIGGLRLLRAWSGPLAATADEMPVIGEIPGAAGLYVAGGTYAFTFAPLWSTTLAAVLHGEAPPVDLSGLDPRRLVIHSQHIEGVNDASLR